MATDPVCGMTVEEKNPEFQSQYADKKYYFCSEECKQQFDKRPNEYVRQEAA
jgi:YHS domain-containing protein